MIQDIRIGRPSGPPWHCDLCGAGDNATRYRNPFTVHVSGERCAPDDPDVGEDIDDLDHEMSLCDRCARTPDVTLNVLTLALRVEASRLEQKRAERLPNDLCVCGHLRDEHTSQWCSALACNCRSFRHG